MKHLVLGLFACTFAFICSATPACKIMIEPLWVELDTNKTSNDFFESKWVVVGKIIFKNRTKESIKLDKLTIAWHGNTLSSLIATLYKTDTDDTFLPTESYVLCDSTWQHAAQSMHFMLPKQFTLEPTSIMYVALTIPPALEQVIKQGAFTIVADSLPRAFQEYARFHADSLNFHLAAQNTSPNPLKQHRS